MTSSNLFTKFSSTSAYSTSEKPLERKNRPPLHTMTSQLFPSKLQKPNFQNIIRQKCLTFLYMMSRRQKILNKEKQLLFSTTKINMLRLFNTIDCENFQYISDDNLAQFFGGSAKMIANLYGNALNKGKIKFCDFVRMLVPLQYNIQFIEIYQDVLVDLSTLDRIIRIFKLISDNQNQNLAELSQLKKQLKLDSVSRLFQSLFLDKRNINYDDMLKLFEENGLQVNQIQMSLIFFKMDKNGDGNLEPTDFQGYF